MRLTSLFRLALLAPIGLVAGLGAALAADPVTVWIHGSRGSTEPAALQAQIDAWNRLHPDSPAKVEVVDKDYADKLIQSRALAGTWPDILDFDGPNFANAAWAGLLAPLDGLVSQETFDNLLPSVVAQGTYAPDGRVYVLGQFDSGLGLWASRSALVKAGVRIPVGVADAWTGDEFDSALAKLQAAGFPHPLDIKLNYGAGEWYTYGMLPIVQSLGGDLIDRTTWRAEGTINGPAAVAALERIGAWIRKGQVVPAELGDDAFYGPDRKAALALVGHWMWPAHSAALGDDLVLLPMPRFGDRHVTGMGSWNWGIWSGSPRKEQAGKLLDFLMSEANVAAMSQAAGAIPALKSVTLREPAFARGGAMAIYTEQLGSIAVPRPSHPAYPVISAAFAEAVAEVISGADAQRALDRAAAMIDQEIDLTAGYAPFGG